MNHLKIIQKEIKAKIRDRGERVKHYKSNVIKQEQAYLLDNPKCEECGTSRNITYDHIIPKTILIDFNIDPYTEFWEANSQSLCKRCNQRKSHSLNLDNPKTTELLQLLIKIHKQIK